jgi:hypothetical protein
MLTQLFSTQFLFQINRVIIEPVDKAFLFVGFAALAIAIFLKVAQKLSPSPVDAAYRSKLFNALLFLSAGEFLWYLARRQFVRFFGTHFVAIVILLIAVVWLLGIAWKMFRHYRSEKTAWEKEQVKLKYLPK